MIRIYDSQQSGLLSTGNIELFRATRMSRERTCPAALTAKGLALLRSNIARHFLGCRESEPPGGHCNRRAKCRYGENLGDSPKGAANADSLEKLFLQAVGNEVRCIGVDATGDVL